MPSRGGDIVGKWVEVQFPSIPPVLSSGIYRRRGLLRHPRQGAIRPTATLLFHLFGGGITQLASRFESVPSIPRSVPRGDSIQRLCAAQPTLGYFHFITPSRELTC